jgi:NAD(P)-dependent dehydrogenase (short-subunit alcohol dehydrogenase family)
MYGTRQLTKDGIELTWAVNHLAPFLLSKLLLHRLKESAPARRSPLSALAANAEFHAEFPATVTASMIKERSDNW